MRVMVGRTELGSIIVQGGDDLHPAPGEVGAVDRDEAEASGSHVRLEPRGDVAVGVGGAKASRLAWSSQAENVQNVLAISWACSPWATRPGVVASWRRMRSASERNPGTKRWERSGRPEAIGHRGTAYTMDWWVHTMCSVRCMMTVWMPSAPR